MLGLSALMFALMVVMLQAFMTPMNIVINAGCFSDVPSIAPRDLAKCSADEVDAAFRRKGVSDGSEARETVRPDVFAGAAFGLGRAVLR